MTIRRVISIGAEFERRNKDGSLKELSIAQQAVASYVRNGKIYTPQVTWEKDFPGQVTLGRIGKPVIRYCPLDWLPLERQVEIKKKMNETI